MLHYLGSALARSEDRVLFEDVTVRKFVLERVVRVVRRLAPEQMAPAAVDCVEALHVGGAQLPIEEGEIADDPLRVDRLGDHRGTALKSPLARTLR